MKPQGPSRDLKQAAITFKKKVTQLTEQSTEVLRTSKWVCLQVEKGRGETFNQEQHG